MAAGWRKFPRSKVLKAIHDSGGIKMVICRRIGCNRSTFDEYLKNDPVVNRVFLEEIEDIGDLCEAGIITKLKERDRTMLIYYSKTKLKHRGYVERQEVENTQPIIVHVDEDDARG